MAQRVPIGLAMPQFPKAGGGGPRGSVRQAHPSAEPAVIAVEGLVRASFEGDPALPEEWGQVAKWTLKMPSRVASSFGGVVTGDFKATGLVDGFPLYQRVAHDGEQAMIGYDAERCLELALCSRVSYFAQCMIALNS